MSAHTFELGLRILNTAINVLTIFVLTICVLTICVLTICILTITIMSQFSNFMDILMLSAGNMALSLVRLVCS